MLPIAGTFQPVMMAMIGQSTQTWTIKQTMFASVFVGQEEANTTKEGPFTLDGF